MNTIKIKGTDIITTRKGSGTVGIGREPWPPMEKTSKGLRPDERTAIDLIMALYEMGERFIDTATTAYELATERIGKALKRLEQRGVNTSEITISDKFGEMFGKEYGDHGEKGSLYDFSEKTLRSVVMKSLSLLGREKIDIMFSHLEWHDDPIKMEEMEIREITEGSSGPALRKLKKEGLIRYTGVSADSLGGAEKAIETGYDVLTINYSITNQNADRNGLFDMALKNNIGIIVRLPYDWGKVFGVNLIDGTEDHHKFKKIKTIANDYNLPLDQMAIQFIMKNPAVDVVIPGTKSIYHAVRNINAANAKPLDNEVYQKLKAI